MDFMFLVKFNRISEYQQNVKKNRKNFNLIFEPAASPVGPQIQCQNLFLRKTEKRGDVILHVRICKYKSLLMHKCIINTELM